VAKCSSRTAGVSVGQGAFQHAAAARQPLGQPGQHRRVELQSAFPRLVPQEGQPAGRRQRFHPNHQPCRQPARQADGQALQSGRAGRRGDDQLLPASAGLIHEPGQDADPCFRQMLHVLHDQQPDRLRGPDGIRSRGVLFRIGAGGGELACGKDRNADLGGFVCHPRDQDRDQVSLAGARWAVQEQGIPPR
jgi:hypothetical protein